MRRNCLRNRFELYNIYKFCFHHFQVGRIRSFDSMFSYKPILSKSHKSQNLAMRFFRSHRIKREGSHAAAATVCRRAREHAAATAILVRSMLQLLMSCSGTFCCGLLVFPHSKVLTPITSSRWPTMIRLWAVIFPLSEGANPLGVARGGGGTTWAPKV